MKHLLLVLAIASGAAIAGENRNWGITNETGVAYASTEVCVGTNYNGRIYPYPLVLSQPSNEHYIAAGYWPVIHREPLDGYEVVESGAFDITNDVIYMKGDLVKLPLRNLQLSKMSLKRNLRDLRLWDAVWTAMKSNPDTLQDWNDTVVPEEQDPTVQAMVQMLLANGVPFATVDRLLLDSQTTIRVNE